MLPRRLSAHINHSLGHSPAVVLLGPRQVGKTTLALEVAETRASVYLDLEDEADRVKLSDPVRYFADHEHELVILDEVQRAPELFQRLRGVIDRRRRHGEPNGQFLLLGSAAMDLLRQSGESLASRISYLELGPFDALEVASAALETLWVRGGFPRSFLADSDDLSMKWRRDFIPVASASVRDGDSAGSVVLVPDYGSQNKYQIQRLVRGFPGTDASRSGNLAQRTQASRTYPSSLMACDSATGPNTWDECGRPSLGRQLHCPQTP